jgi:3-oxoacyl-[acyl-carrier-protein] synthase I
VRPPAGSARKAEPLALTGFDLVSAVGGDAVQTCASLRARVSRVAEFPHYYPTGSDPGWNDDEPLLAATVTDLAPALSLRERMVELASRVLRQLPARFALKRSQLARTALLLALPWADAAVKEAEVIDQLVPDLLRACALPAFGAGRVLPGGHTAVFELVAEAERILGEGEADLVILLAVDSYFSPRRLELLDQAWRLRSNRNVDGFIPGEAAAALLIEPMARGKERASSVRAILHPVECASEPNIITSDMQSTGRGLASAIEKALGTAVGCPWVVCDMNGESYRAYEWGLATALLPEQLGHIARLSHPAESIGDVGAVSGAVSIALAASGFARGYAPGLQALLWASSDDKTRAALRIEAPAPPARGAS